MMRRIVFLHGDIFDFDSNEEKIAYFIRMMNIDYKTNDFIWDEDDPEFVFVSEHLYYGKNNDKIVDILSRLIKKNNIKIFYAGECIEPDLNLFDYAIVFDRNLKDEDRIIRIPYFTKFHKSIFNKRNSIITISKAKKELSKKKKFCNFIYSNGNAHPMRDKLFYEISKYKQVDSLGSHLRNKEVTGDVLNITDWRLQSIKLKESYKFTIASENASYPGYISEKLYTSFQAHSVPIYFGDREVRLEFNNKAFINAMDYDTIDDLIKEIKRIDENDEEWCKIIKEPWVTEEQVKNHIKIEKEYNCFFDKLFNGNFMELQRISIGFHPENYRNNLYKKDMVIIPKKDNIIKRIIKRVFK